MRLGIAEGLSPEDNTREEFQSRRYHWYPELRRFPGIQFPMPHPAHGRPHSDERPRQFRYPINPAASAPDRTLTRSWLLVTDRAVGLSGS